MRTFIERRSSTSNVRFLFAGIGWTSWKKRWFILTRTSLVFYRTDPSVLPQKGSEVNLVLGGIDLYNSGSVAIKADKKLLTVLFPDGRAFTLKAETFDDLLEWKAALEDALSQAPSASLPAGQNVLKSKQSPGTDGILEQSKDKIPTKSLVVGRPILLALEDVDGSPSFLEKSLRFIEIHGVRVEGILRQAADVDEVERRIRQYEQGKTEFLHDEDAHVVADCVKYFLRELPSSPVPASCCKALLEACRTDRSNRVHAMKIAICETFPEPNRRLLQRILLMMQTVASQKSVNRMSSSAVAACMAPLLLRPLLGGECEITTDFDVGGDGSMQLLQAAAAANHAQTIVITLLEEYQTIFSEGTISPGLYSDSEGDSADEVTEDDDDAYYEEEEDGTPNSDDYTDDDIEHTSGEECSDSDGSYEDVLSTEEADPCSLDFKFLDENVVEVQQQALNKTGNPERHDSHIERFPNKSIKKLQRCRDDCDPEVSRRKDAPCHEPSADIEKANTRIIRTSTRTVWGRTSARKNLSMESIDFSVEEMESIKLDLQNRISEEVKSNALMQAELEERKRTLTEQRASLQREIVRLQDQLQKERDKSVSLRAVIKGETQPSVVIDEKLKKDIEEITRTEKEVSNLKDRVDELKDQLDLQERKDVSLHGISDQLREKQKDGIDCPVPPLQNKSSSKDSQREKGEGSDAKKIETDSLKDKPKHRKSQQDSGSSNSKTGTKSEIATTSTSLALTKLTNTLNFLKERRSQHANELQNLEKVKTSCVGKSSPRPEKVQDIRQQLLVGEKGTNSETTHGSPNQQRGKSVDGSMSCEDGSTYQQPLLDSEINRKQHRQGLQDAANVQVKVAECHFSHKADKGKGGKLSAPWTKTS